MPLCRKSWLWCWEQGFFTCWQLASCQSTQLWISLCWRLADRPIQGTNALPFPHCRLSAPFTYNIIQMQNLSIPVIIPPLLSLPTTPWQQVFFIYYFSPTAQNMARSSSHQDRKSLESAGCLSFLGTLIQCNEEVTERERERRTERGGWGWRVTQTQISDLSINQAVTTRCLSNWIAPGSPERAQTILSLALLNY